MNISSVKFKNISHLNIQHHHIFNLFLEYQKLLMHGVSQSADDKFEELKKYIKYHMDAENDFLLPLYQKYISPIPAGGAVEFFIHEHHKINRYLDEFTTMQIDVSEESLDMVHLFDQHYKFKHLLDHHHLREHTFLFRLLDRVLPAEEKKEVLKCFIFGDI
jgi:hypothetical protein